MMGYMEYISVVKQEQIPFSVDEFDDRIRRNIERL